MALQLPQQRKQVRQIQIERERVPIDQIIAVKGKSMWAPAIDQTGNVIGQVLARRAENKRQGEILAGLEKVSGQEPGAYKGLTPEIAQVMASANMKSKVESQEIARKMADNILKVRALEKQFNYPPNSLGDDYDSAKMKVQADIQANSTSMGFRAEANRIREEQFKEKQVNAYSDDLQKTNIPGAISVGERVLSLLPERGENIPGFGPLEQYKPNILSGDKARTMRQAVLQLFNIELKDRSGAAVVDSELQRLKNEYGQGNFATEEALRQGITQYLNRLSEIGKNVVSGYSPEIVGEYQSRGGRNVNQVFDSLKSSKKIGTPGLQPLPVPGAQKKATMRWNPKTGRVEEIR